LTKKEKLALVGGMFARERSLSQNFRMSTTMLEVDEPSISDTRDSDTLAMAWHDEKYNNNQIDTVITKNSTHARVSELSIGIDDLKRFRAEAGYSEDDSIGKFAGKSVRSIVELIDYASVNSFAISEETRPTNRRQQITSPQAQINDLVEDDGAPMKHTGDSAEVMVHPLGSSHVTEVKEKEGNTHTHGVFDEMEDLNQMIESDNIRDLHSETMMMAEEFKLSSSFLEDPPDLQPDDSERVREDLNLMIESDNIRDLKSETMMMAEEFKLRLSLLESLSDLQPGISERVGEKLKDDGIHTLDVSNATSTSTSTAITEYGSKGFTLPPDGSLSQSNRDCPESMVISSAGESSGGDVLSSEGTCAKNSEGYSRQQHAGEPSGDCRSPLIPNNDIVFDKAEGGTNLNAFNPLVPIQDGRPKTPTTESGTILSPRSSISSKSPMASVSSGLHSQVNTSQSSNNSKYNSISINGWKPTGVMGTLLADLSDSTSTSSRAESMTDSIASLEVISNQSHSKVRIGKDIEKLLNRHGFNAGKAAAERYEDCATDEKNESRATKISTTRQKKRELEARKLSFQSSSSSS
jgi:bacterioferritin (cytochrome b1)